MTSSSRSIGQEWNELLLKRRTAMRTPRRFLGDIAAAFLAHEFRLAKRQPSKKYLGLGVNCRVALCGSKEGEVESDSCDDPTQALENPRILPQGLRLFERRW